MTLLLPWLSEMAAHASGPLQIRHLSSYQECEHRSATLTGMVDWNTFCYQPAGDPDETTRDVLFDVDAQYGALRQRLEIAIADKASVQLSRLTGIALRDAIAVLTKFFHHMLPIADGFIREFCLVVTPRNDTVRLVLFYATKCLIHSTYSQAFADDAGRCSVTSFPEHVDSVLNEVYATDRDLPTLHMPGSCFICSVPIAGQCVRLTCGHVVHRLCHFESMRRTGSRGLCKRRDAKGRWNQGNLGQVIACVSCSDERDEDGFALA